MGHDRTPLRQSTSVSALSEEAAWRSLDADGWRVCVTDEGGAILRCDWNGKPVLRASRRATKGSPFESGYFPLAPYSNRIGGGAFQFGDRKIEIPPNFNGEPYPIHGSAWLGDWTTIAHGARSISQVYFASGSKAWPWPFALTQTISVSGATLSVRLSIENRADEPAPAGLGFHPYFPDPASAQLAFKAGGVWQADPQNMPSEWRASTGIWDFSAGRALSTVVIDNCFTNWTGDARIVWCDRALALDLCADAPARFAVVYVPQDQSCFCFEPVSHMNDAFNRARHGVDTGLRILQPGERFAVEMRIRASELC